jgi:hypothetical protein
MEEENNRIFSLVLKNAWTGAPTEEEIVELQAWQSRSSFHQTLPDRFADLDWINGKVSEIHKFRKEVVRQRIIESIEGLEATTANVSETGHAPYTTSSQPGKRNYINVETSTEYIRVHKHWRVTFMVIFIYSKVLLVVALYYYMLWRKCH